jgi:hypothetical protein
MFFGKSFLIWRLLAARAVCNNLEYVKSSWKAHLYLVAGEFLGGLPSSRLNDTHTRKNSPAPNLHTLSHSVFCYRSAKGNSQRIEKLFLSLAKHKNAISSCAQGAAACECGTATHTLKLNLLVVTNFQTRSDSTLSLAESFSMKHF